MSMYTLVLPCYCCSSCVLLCDMLIDINQPTHAQRRAGEREKDLAWNRERRKEDKNRDLDLNHHATECGTSPRDRHATIRLFQAHGGQANHFRYGARGHSVFLMSQKQHARFLQTKCDGKEKCSASNDTYHVYHIIPPSTILPERKRESGLLLVFLCPVVQGTSCSYSHPIHCCGGEVITFDAAVLPFKNVPLACHMEYGEAFWVQTSGRSSDRPCRIKTLFTPKFDDQLGGTDWFSCQYDKNKIPQA